MLFAHRVQQNVYLLNYFFLDPYRQQYVLIYLFIFHLVKGVFFGLCNIQLIKKRRSCA